MPSTSPLLPPVVVGEVLFDHFPDGNRVLGGAPLNLAWNLQGLGVPSIFISAVGKDSEGELIQQEMTSWGMSTRGLQIVDHPTGRVSVTMVDGQPEYDIVNEVAFDFIQPPSFPITANEFSMLCYGSLAFRCPTTRRTLTDLIQQSGLDRFVDINIRDPFFDVAWLDTLLGGARWVKLSEAELSRLVDAPCNDQSQIAAGCETLRGRFDIDTVLVTCGSEGAHACSAGSHEFSPVAPVDSLADTVGAGDSFAAATIAGLIRNVPIREILPKAAKFASQVCTIHGATSKDQSFYDQASA
ncbi:Bifunctional protein HldE [Rubripirellula lacrimiformis]|uniref:Bifunctional protein HldE n=1 Tax=Rubripirellula lacrimiformis TaxID=1930273 RepID=A0A517N511_9BACT|nr:PfkB family carbohydrate kinase [Rubripirellula lacrimiformis]QDT02230.1 Bifunctional protein HldE [Rubripirellula lacrimiformis]